MKRKRKVIRRIKKKAARKTNKRIFWVSGSLLLLILCVVGWRIAAYRQAAAEYEALARAEAAKAETAAIVEKEAKEKEGQTSAPEQIHETEAPGTETLNPKLKDQKDINPDIIGWIEIPDTNVDYPIMQGGDNDYYTDHTFYRTENPAGSIFMEVQNQSDFSDIVTFVYGHRMKDGSMFGNLKYYGEKEYWEEHPEFYVSTYQDNRVYEIFSVHRAEITDSTFRLFLKAGEEYEAYLKEEQGKSYYDTDVDVGSEDQIVVLVTCTTDVKDERIVVLGKLKECEAFDTEDGSDSTKAVTE